MTMRHHGVILAATVPAIILSGCGSKSKQDTPYKGSYRAVYTIPALNESGTLSFTVEQKGGMTGAFTDNNSGKNFAFNGELAPSGYFSGNLKDGANSYPIDGTLAITGDAKGGGDFKQTRNKQEYRGSFSLTANVITATPGSTFRGAYSGSYNVPGLSQTGTTSFSVNANGDINGSLTRGSETGAFTGKVSENGTLAGNAQFGTETISLTGTLNKTTDGSTSGNFTLTQGGKSYPGSFGTTQTAPAGDSPYNGAYRGTYGVPENQETGNISFTVDPRGALTGFFSQSANKPVGTFTGSFNNDGTFAGTVTYDPSTGIAVRPITGKLAKSSVNGKQAGDFNWTINGKALPGNFEVAIGASEADSIYRGSYGGSNIFEGLSIIGTTGTSLDKPTFTQVRADSLGVYDTNYDDNRPNELDPTQPTIQYLDTVSTMSVTIDKQGNIVGNLGGFPLDARVTNDGRVFGTVAGYPLRGVLSRQKIASITDVTATPVYTDVLKETKDKDGNPTVVKIGQNLTNVSAKYTQVNLDGIAGDFVITVNGKEYQASTAGIGGNAEGASPR